MGELEKERGPDHFQLDVYKRQPVAMSISNNSMVTIPSVMNKKGVRLSGCFIPAMCIRERHYSCHHLSDDQWH